jgi:hypothetical protein
MLLMLLILLLLLLLLLLLMLLSGIHFGFCHPYEQRIHNELPQMLRGSSGHQKASGDAGEEGNSGLQTYKNALLAEKEERKGPCYGRMVACGKMMSE